MTKRRFIVAAALISLLALLVLCIHWLVINPSQPSYQSFSKQPTVAPFTGIQYESLNPCPFEGGLMWVTIWSTNSSHYYLYDLDHHLILGELKNALPVILNRDHDKVLCYML